MSFHTLLGAFPVEGSGAVLEPQPGARLGELRASSRGVALFQAVGAILDAVPGHDMLRFIARQHGTLPGRSSDPQTRWTLIDPAAAADVVATLDKLLLACDQHADALASRVSFGADQLDPSDLRRAMQTAHEWWESGGALPDGDGDSAEYLFSVLLGLRDLLRKAIAAEATIAFFTWAPA